MRELLLLSFCLFIHAHSWPPNKCKTPITIIDNTVVMTSKTVLNVRTSCLVEETYKNNMYIEFTRIYNGENKNPSDSILDFSFIFQGQPRFTLEIHNDRVKVVSEKETSIQTASHECLAVLAHASVGSNNWLRLRINHLMELQRTFLSVDLASHESNSFSPCIRFEMPWVSEAFNIKMSAFTSSGMYQEVSQLTSIRPNLTNKRDNKLVPRIKNLESQVNRIQDTVQQYMELHQEHVLKMESSHAKLRKRVANTHNHIESKTQSHFILWLFLFSLAAISVAGFVSWKFKEAKRFHLL